MRIADILRQLADNIDGHAPGGTPDPAIQNKAPSAIPTGQNIIIDVEAEEESSPNGQTAAGNDKEPEDLFLPPLQQKQELLKKAVGVENIYDDGQPSDQDSDEESEEYDIVDRIKQLSGVPTAAIQELSNDEVLDD